MGDVLQFAPRERRSNADSVFPPIIAQEDIDTQEADEKRRALVGKMGTYIRHGLIWAVIWVLVLAAIGLSQAI